tara:strand:- start:213 stop:821 length:609 start_codon:yes stop_codon:yes gene_type:complete
MANPMYGQNKFDDILGNAKLLKSKLAYLSWNWQDLGYEAKSDANADSGYTLRESYVNGSLWDGDGAAASMVLPSATVGALVVFRFNAQADGGQSITFTTASGDYYEDGTLMLTVDNNGDGQLSQPNYLQGWVQAVATSGGTIVTTASTHNTLAIASTATNNQTNIGAELVWFCEKAGYWKLAFKGSELGSGAVNATFATSAV